MNTVHVPMREAKRVAKDTAERGGELHELAQCVVKLCEALERLNGNCEEVARKNT